MTIEEVGSTNLRRIQYSFGGRVVAQRDSAGSLIYLHGDHLGSASLATSGSGGGAVLSRQEFDPWGKVRSNTGITQTTLNYTGQKLDGTGLLFYNARYYDPALGRFISPDTIVPLTASGKGGAAPTLGKDKKSELRSLTVAFHEVEFNKTLNSENKFTLAKGFWFELKKKDQKDAKIPWGPENTQALNRYSYVLNNPIRYTDPTGHWERWDFWATVERQELVYEFIPGTNYLISYMHTYTETFYYGFDLYLDNSTSLDIAEHINQGALIALIPAAMNMYAAPIAAAIAAATNWIKDQISHGKSIGVRLRLLPTAAKGVFIPTIEFFLY